jgi:hypothetical protein
MINIVEHDEVEVYSTVATCAIAHSTHSLKAVAQTPDAGVQKGAREKRDDAKTPDCAAVGSKLAVSPRAEWAGCWLVP